MTNIQIMRAAVRAYPLTDMTTREAVRRNRVAYIKARQHLGDRALLAGGVWSKSISVLHAKRDAVVFAVVMVAGPIGIGADIMARGL